MQHRISTRVMVLETEQTAFRDVGGGGILFAEFLIIVD